MDYDSTLICDCHVSSIDLAHSNLQMFSLFCDVPLSCLRHAMNRGTWTYLWSWPNSKRERSINLPGTPKPTNLRSTGCERSNQCPYTPTEKYIELVATSGLIPRAMINTYPCRVCRSTFQSLYPGDDDYESTRGSPIPAPQVSVGKNSTIGIVYNASSVKFMMNLYRLSVQSGQMCHSDLTTIKQKLSSLNRWVGLENQTSFSNVMIASPGTETCGWILQY